MIFIFSCLSDCFAVMQPVGVLPNMASVFWPWATSRQRTVGQYNSLACCRMIVDGKITLCSVKKQHAEIFFAQLENTSRIFDNR